MTAPASRADVATPNASRYLQQLCKHFGHKIPATFDATTGHIAFAFGECRLKAGDDRLEIALTAPGEDDLARLQQVIGSHLLRFAFREDLAIDWQPGRPAA